MQAAPLPWEIVFTQTPAGRREPSRLVLLARDRTCRVLTPEFHSAADPEVSFDGKRILFAGKRQPSDRWDIFEMDAAGGAPRRITRDLGNCRSPVYQSPIFYLDDPAPAAQIAFVSDEAGEPAPALYSARMDGSKIRRLTYAPAGAFHPAMLPDGRMLFSAGRLFGVNIDGTDYAAFSGSQGRSRQLMACVTARRQVVFVEPEPGSRDGAGPLAMIELRRNLHSYRRLTLPAAGAFHSPSPLPDGAVLAARRPATGGAFAVYRFDPAARKLEMLWEERGSDLTQPRALVERPIPDGRSSVVDEKEPWGKLYCLNLYESDLSPQVWKQGLVKRVRLVEGRPARLIGEFGVEEDGSFNAQLPANVPFQIQALDEDGMALRSSAWIWVKNKEQRGCIGCHEDGERTPENVLAKALTRQSINLMLEPERRRSVDFRRDIAPVLERKCSTAACHGGKAAPKLGASHVTPGTARTSPLVWALFGRNTSRPWDRAPGAAAPAKPPSAHSSILTRAERRAIVEWIDLGAGGFR